MIELNGVTKQYLYGARVLGTADITVSDGEIVALLGGVGSGKTSLLKAVTGVTDCEGEVLFDGAPISKKPDGIVMIFDDLAQFERRNFFYNLAYPLKIRGVAKEEIAAVVYDAAARLGITACLYQRVSKATPVERKRLSLARLYLRRTKHIFIDDITSGLSAEDAQTLWAEVIPILREKAGEGASIIFATSKLSEAMSVADRIAVMHAGEIKQLDSYDNIAANPASVWAAEALDPDFAFERVALKPFEGALNAVFDGRYAVNIDEMKDRILPSYLDKEVLAGWKSQDYDLDGERAEQVEYAVRTKDGYVLHAGGRAVHCPYRRDSVGTLPKRDKILLFDATNENSILI